jgi:hypothetical protein
MSHYQPTAAIHVPLSKKEECFKSIAAHQLLLSVDSGTSSAVIRQN